MKFIYNGDSEVEIEPGNKFLAWEGDWIENEHITYDFLKTGFYEFTGHWFFFLFPW